MIYNTQSLEHTESIHVIIAHTNFDVYREVVPDFQCCAILLLLLLKSSIDAIGFLHVLLVSVV